MELSALCTSSSGSTVAMLVHHDVQLSTLTVCTLHHICNLPRPESLRTSEYVRRNKEGRSGSLTRLCGDE